MIDCKENCYACARVTQLNLFVILLVEVYINAYICVKVNVIYDYTTSQYIRCVAFP